MPHNLDPIHVANAIALTGLLETRGFDDCAIAKILTARYLVVPAVPPSTSIGQLMNNMGIGVDKESMINCTKAVTEFLQELNYPFPSEEERLLLAKIPVPTEQ